jgi:adenylosuccinate synthase
MPGKIQVVVGGQFGSEGKGAVCRWLASQAPAPICCRVGGPNAGHTAFDSSGKEWKLQQVPVGALATAHPLVIGAGSEIDTNILDREILALEDAGIPVAGRLRIDQGATFMAAEYGRAEMEGRAHGEAGLTARIGSTGKGVGAARADRVWRKALTMRDVCSSTQPCWRVWKTNSVLMVDVIDTASFMRDQLFLNRTVQIEGTQGYGLGLHTPYYPFVTSGDCRAVDMLAQAGLSPWGATELEVWVVFRTHPIRVAGNSGPLKYEIGWDQLPGVEPEITTVTKKQRRIGLWDGELARQALGANGAPSFPRLIYRPSRIKVAMLFLDYLFSELAGVQDSERVEAVAGAWILDRERELQHPIHAVGTGPNTIVRRHWA